jgi:hypothetical protein
MKGQTTTLMLVLLAVEGGEIVVLNRQILRIDNIEYRSTCLREAASAKAGETSNNVQNTNDRNVYVFEFEHLNFGFVSSFDIRISDLI